MRHTYTPETAPAAKLSYAALFATGEPINWLREHAEESGWRGLEDDDYAYATDLLSAGYRMPVVLERLRKLVDYVWESNGGEPLERWDCLNCNERYDERWDAQNCCPPRKIYLCGHCGGEELSESGARVCCKPGARA